MQVDQRRPTCLGPVNPRQRSARGSPDVDGRWPGILGGCHVFLLVLCRYSADRLCQGASCTAYSSLDHAVGVHPSLNSKHPQHIDRSSADTTPQHQNQSATLPGGSRRLSFVSSRPPHMSSVRIQRASCPESPSCCSRQTRPVGSPAPGSSAPTAPARQRIASAATRWAAR